MVKNKKLPRLERGRDLSRIVAFTDGVFAIAITLLILQIEVPVDASSASDLFNGLLDESEDFLAFGISFAVTGSFWISNHRFMRTIAEFDRGLMWLLLLYLGAIVLIPFSSQLIGEYGGSYSLSTILYIANMTAVALASTLMMNHVLRRGLAKPEYEWDIELTVKSALFTIGVFLITIPLALLFGSWVLAIWAVLWFDPFEGRRDRVYAELELGSASESESESALEADRGEAVDDPPPGK